jgi:hypothetical protein
LLNQESFNIILANDPSLFNGGVTPSKIKS